MRETIFINLMLASVALGSPRALREHVDLHWEYDEQDGWACLAKTVVNGDDVFEELEDVYLVIDDAPVASNGQRYLQPEGEINSFTGVSPGDPVWIAPKFEQAGQCWPGFNNYQATGVFGSYQETDTRLSQADRDLAQPWIRITLEGVTYQGEGSGHLSLWDEEEGDPPSVWFSSFTNTHPDTYLFQAGGHKHLYWGFSSPGIYRVRLSASAYSGPGESNPTLPSDVFAVTFAVGAFAQWQATHFSANELDNLFICGPEADPDQDGMKNLVEFGFGFNPKSGVLVAESPGLGLPKLSVAEENGIFYHVLGYSARRAGEQFSPLRYLPQFAADMHWQSDGITTTSADFPPEMNGLNAVWEKVTARRPVGPEGLGRRFGRVGVGFGE